MLTLLNLVRPKAKQHVYTLRLEELVNIGFHSFLFLPCNIVSCMRFSNVENILSFLLGLNNDIYNTQRFHFSHDGGRSISTDRDGFQLTRRLLRFVVSVLTKFTCFNNFDLPRLLKFLVVELHLIT